MLIDKDSYGDILDRKMFIAEGFGLLNKAIDNEQIRFDTYLYLFEILEKKHDQLNECLKKIETPNANLEVPTKAIITHN